VRSREARFIGHGNFTQGDGHCRINAWRLICSRCQDIKVIAMPHGDLPPNLLIKKFNQAGWNVGKRAKHDLCSVCQKKKPTPQAPAPQARPAPPPPPPPPAPPPVPALAEIISLQVAYDKILMNIHALLCAGKINDARQVIEAHLPDAKAPRLITPTEILKRDTTFDEWLDNLQKNHRTKASKP
jgi:hypothetical protein